MFKRSFIWASIWMLVCASASGQEASAIANGPQGSGADTVPGYRVGGVVSSSSGRMALVNGRASRVGDRVDGAEIVAIDERSVHIRTESGEFTAYIGGRVVRNQTAVSAPPASPRRVAQQLPAESETSITLTASPAPADESQQGQAQHLVESGETLSGIAKRHLSADVTMNQMMMAMYRANPAAFSGNINRLHAGAMLKIPDPVELRYEAPETATSAVARHELEWRHGTGRYARQALPPDGGRYGPVSNGEVLSEIASRIAPAGVTLNQMMMAMFRANPEAFSGNINRLHAGAVLKVPDLDELRDQEPAVATAEVARQMNSWRPGSPQQARITTTPASDRHSLEPRELLSVSRLFAGDLSRQY
ncbi:MAG: type IV pilus assembly protein FimV [Gammaproteobacteria bacterium]